MSTDGDNVSAGSVPEEPKRALPQGYDAAVARQRDDLLSRWPFAKEVYRAAATGPREWSVRIGVYGEWGAGKTSVLNFVETMGVADGHVVVRFNPWQYSDKKTLWHAFVQEVAAALPTMTAATGSAKRTRMKRLVSPIANWVAKHGQRISGAVDDKRAALAVVGVDLLKDFVLSNRKDVEQILADLGGKRLIVLIDDLDRTSGDLVPEMLFAIKEILNLPGVAFVCAFDPLVVGEVLREHQPQAAERLEPATRREGTSREIPLLRGGATVAGALE